MNSNCTLQSNNGTLLKDVRLNGLLLEHSSPALRYLSIVETDRIPLHLILGPPCSVTTSDTITAAWFGKHLSEHLGGHGNRAWWQSLCADSPRGILAAVDTLQQHNNTGEELSGRGPRVTEILFYASKEACPTKETQPSPPASPSKSSNYGKTRLSVQAIPLSSDLLYNGHAFTPPLSPTGKNNELSEVDSVFLPWPTYNHSGCDAPVVHHPPTRKKRTANDAFDAADQRRRNARHRGGESIIAAAGTTTTAKSANAAASIPSLRHQRSTSNGINSPILGAPKPRAFSRSASVASSSRLGQPSFNQTASATHEKRSSLSRFESPIPHLAEPVAPLSNALSTFEQKNKETISRVVMAGMRLHGLSQQRPSKSRSNSVSLRSIQISTDNTPASSKDDEYKLVYHQVYKAACFAFRRSMSCESLAQRPEVTGEVIEGLLTLFLKDPLESGEGGEAEEPAGEIGDCWG